ncbi:MAG: alpha/beta fold hydrolase [Candidatus Woesearchaeota archaeon]|nr:MAG: alpha/beta fold hydrolase [Candidatus Woesearchaeota archaeon]
MNKAKTEFFSADMHKLVGHICEKNNDTLVVLMHGFLSSDEHPPISNLFASLAEEFTVFSFDFSGHGASQGTIGQMTPENYVREAKAAIRLMQTKIRPKQVILIGHSMGGVVALEHIDLAAGVICLGSPMHPDLFKHRHLSPEEQEELQMKKEVTTTIFDEEVTITQNFIDAFEALSPLDRIASSKKPIIVMHGVKDSAVPVEEAREAMQANELVELYEFETGHLLKGFEEKIGQLLRKRIREEFSAEPRKEQRKTFLNPPPLVESTSSPVTQTRDSVHTMIQEGDFVEIDFTGVISSTGAVFDTTEPKVAQEEGLGEGNNLKPIIICVGKKQILPGLDKAIIGKDVGTFVAKITPEEGFGKKDPSLVRMIPLRVFKEQNIRPQVGMPVTINGVQGLVRTVSSGRILVDFNHPLSSQELDYRVTIHRLITDPKEQIIGLLEHMGIKGEVEMQGETAVCKANIPEQAQTLVTDKVKELTGKSVLFAK